MTQNFQNQRTFTLVPGLLIIFFFLTFIGLFLMTTAYFTRPQIFKRGYHMVINRITYDKNSDHKVNSIKLNDKLADYYSNSSSVGISACKDETGLKEKFDEGKISLVSPRKGYTIEKMRYSYPYLTKSSNLLLQEIGDKFSEKIPETRLKNSRFILTSMTRTTSKISELQKINSNASVNSPHLNGNAFDITYVRFKSNRLILTGKDKKYLKKVLAETIWDLRKEKKCWATYERNQHCFHIVAR